MATLAMPVMRLMMPAAEGWPVSSRREAMPRKTLKTAAIAAQVSPSAANCIPSGRGAAAVTNYGRKAKKNMSDLAVRAIGTAAISGPIPAATTKATTT